VLSAVVFGALELSGLPILAIVVGLTLMATLRLLPTRAGAQPRARPPRWDLTARILVGTTLIVALTTVAPSLGPRASGLISTYPVYVGTLTYFAHRQGGPSAVAAMLRGLTFGLFGWLAFWTALLAILPTAGVAAGFGIAIAAALVIQGISLRVLGPASVAAVGEVGEVVP
jgi:hypothetical protein